MSSFIATSGKLSDFKACPWKFWLLHGSKHIFKKPVIPFSKNQWTAKGDEIHELMKVAGISTKHGHMLPAFKSPLWQPWWYHLLKKFIGRHPNCLIEQKIGIANDWTGWELGDYYRIDPNEAGSFHNKKDRFMTVRSAFDAVFFDTHDNPEYARIVDWKSGKPRKSEGLGQLALYAMMAFCYWPTLEKIDCLYIFLEHKKFEMQSYSKSEDFQNLQNWFAAELGEINQTFQRLADTEPRAAFYAQPGTCHYCPAERCHCPHSRK